ncbi:glycine cleavage system transcriptional repressor [Abditibacterium utsteinense]|uniref:Glycine cleavage system transcriptional repressor n=1 Tax=Abditibacterium utsteinense TaxID=1960156 RepID=A0A2S8STN2_9BACT|nr:ACT domain-containing protein [Abditibacterium utsteinense]PQV64138.1 glycine cleavage system transcriptional repressor [Abditibacterium utsteinense]
MLIITAVGPDKPGMAHAVAQILFEGGCNIEDTTMTRLSGQFSMILAVTPPQNVSLDELTARLEALRAQNGLVVDVSEVSKAEIAPQSAPRYLLTAYGPESVGLLAKLTGILTTVEVNITDVQTRVAQKGTVYVMLLELELPAALTPEKLKIELQNGAGDLQISLREVDEETL